VKKRKHKLDYRTRVQKDSIKAKHVGFEGVQKGSRWVQFSGKPYTNAAMGKEKTHRGTTAREKSKKGKKRGCWDNLVLV